MYVHPLRYVLVAFICALVGGFAPATASSLEQRFETYCDIDSWLPHTVVVRRATEPLRVQTLVMGWNTPLLQAVRVRWGGSEDAVSVVCEPDITTIDVVGTEMPDGSREAIIFITVPPDLLPSIHLE